MSICKRLVYFVHWRNTILSSYLLQTGLLDSASAKIKAIGAQLPAEFYLLGSHSSHKISWHSAALLCEACDCCHVLQGMVGKAQWCHMCWPQRAPSLVVLCQCSCPQCNAQVMPRKGKCLAFFLHLCSCVLLGGGTEGPQLLCKRNVWCSAGGRGWMGEGWWVQNVSTPALLITMQEKPVALVFCSVLWKHPVKQLKLLSLELFYW